jgi:hypothetical protein
MFKEKEQKEEPIIDWEKIEKEIKMITSEEFKAYKDKAEILYVGDIRTINEDLSRAKENINLEHANEVLQEAEKAKKQGKEIIVVGDEKTGYETYIVSRN